MSINLKEHLNLLKIKDIKGLIRQYNLHNKIKLSQKKPELISDLLKHFEDTITDNNVTSKKYEATLPKIEEPKPKAENELMKYNPNDHAMNYSEEKSRLLREMVGKYRLLTEENKNKLEDIENKLVDKFIKSFKRRPSKPTIQNFIREMQTIPEYKEQYNKFIKYTNLQQQAEHAHQSYQQHIPHPKYRAMLRREK